MALHTCRVVSFGAAAAALLVARAPAQCAPQWVPSSGLSGTNSDVLAVTVWDPDGSGPQPPLLILGGQFTFAGTTAANRIVAWDPASDSWTPFGSGANGLVTALTTAANGDLVAGGFFTSINGVAANHIARWNGTVWTPLGPGVGGPVEGVLSLLALANGDLVAGGALPNGIARWNGATWSGLGSGVAGGQQLVRALALLGNGDLVAGGNFLTAGGTAATHLARWNGVAWSAMGNPTATVNALAVRPNGDLVAAGDFTSIGGSGAPHVARWNGAAWSAMGGGSAGNLAALAVQPNGDVLAGGFNAFTAGAQSASVARWNGSAWTMLGGHSARVAALASLPAGDVVAGATASGLDDNVRRWNPTAGWQPLHTAPMTSPTAFVLRSNGDLVACGLFGGAYGIARWTGGAWTTIGVANGGVTAIVERPNGDLVVGGTFTVIGGTSANGIASWNGAAWSPLGAGFIAPVQALAVLPGGDVVAGSSVIARWNGTAWLPMGGGLFTSDPFDYTAISVLVTMPNGDLVAAGHFDRAGGLPAANIARWNGTSWLPILPGIGLIYALQPLPNGDLLVGGDFDFAGGVLANSLARWNGTTWSAGAGGGVTVSNGSKGFVQALLRLPDGDILAGGYFAAAGGVPANRIARWNGTTWSALGAGTDGTVTSLGFAPEGVVFVSGNFTSAGGMPSPLGALLVTPCTATAAPLGAGCPSSGGANRLVVMSRPWIGGQLRSVATGLPAQVVPAALLGFTPLNLPLANFFGEAVAGCNGYVSPDFVDVLPPGGSTVVFARNVPDVPAIVGLAVAHQMLSFEFDANGNSIALTSTNAVALTIGDY
jgi:hypothetical protein